MADTDIGITDREPSKAKSTIGEDEEYIVSIRFAGWDARKGIHNDESRHHSSHSKSQFTVSVSQITLRPTQTCLQRGKRRVIDS